MRNMNYLRRQINSLLAQIEEEQRVKDECAVVIYDARSGLPLPGYEPSPSATRLIFIPHNGREER